MKFVQSPKLPKASKWRRNKQLLFLKTMNQRKEKKERDSTTLTAVALQDHLVKSLGLSDVIGPRHVGLGPAARAKQKKEIKSRIEIGRFGRNRRPQPKKEDKLEKEYVLDPKPPPMTLAQKMGLVEAPGQLLSENDWQHAKEKSNKRDDSKHPCVICKEDFGLQEQVLLSCTHVFHRACLQAFERFTGKKTCPMCRKEQYQTRVIHEGSRQYRHKCATVIQACWRRYIVRCWYLKLRETNPPKDPRLRKKFYEEKLHHITDRMVRSCDFNVNQFLSDIDRNLEASRNVFKDFDARFQQISEEDWETIQLKAVERGDTDCPICLTDLVSQSYIQKQTAVNNQKMAKNSKTNPTNTSKQPNLHSHKAKKLEHSNGLTETDEWPESRNQCDCKRTVLLSCSHVFHETCLEMFEELCLENSNLCPVCRAKYQKTVLNT